MLSHHSTSLENRFDRIPSHHESTDVCKDPPEAYTRTRSCPAVLMKGTEDCGLHRILSTCTSTPTKILRSAKKNLYLSRRALCCGPPPLSLILDIGLDVESLVDDCNCDKRSELEAAFRREVSAALDIPVSSVIVDCVRTPSAGCTEVCAHRLSADKILLSLMMLVQSLHRYRCSWT